DKLLAQRHKDITLFEFEGKKVPCIIIEEKRFDEIMKSIAGKPVSVETNLNILQDGLGHVFVRITLSFSQVQIEEKILLYANESFEFFQALTDTSMLALSSPHSEYGRSNVFMIQLPKPERTENALEMIKKGLKM
ncbi:MAG TPA: hypothetical protein VJR22_06270, partial [Candidatus Nitrosotalea sp.]|nr:hypothetical protein [Candidatus Nitrosotalea sp.]